MKVSQPVFKITGEKPSDWKRELVECPQWEPFYWSMESAIYSPCPFSVKCIGEDWVMRQKIYVRTDIYPLAWIWYFLLFRVEKSWAWVARKIKGGDRNE